jgi:transposase
VIVTVRLRRRRLVCSGYGQGRRQRPRPARQALAPPESRRLPLLIEFELRRVWCRDCGPRLEAVPWARAGSGYTRDFEDLVAYLAQQMARAPIAPAVADRLGHGREDR